MLGDIVEQLTVELIERAEESVAQLHGASDDRVEDRLRIGPRPADDPQDLACRRMLLEGLRQALLEVVPPEAFGLRRRAGDRSRRFGFAFTGLSPGA